MIDSGRRHMRVIELNNYGSLVSRVKPIPRPGHEEVLIRVEVTGICGSDLSTFNGEHPYKTAPTVLGHEFSGTIVSLNSSVTRFEIGQRVCSAAFSPCDQCFYCASEKQHLCQAKTTYSYQGWMGSFADYVVAKQNMLFPLPDSIDAKEAAMVEPLAIGLHAVRLSALHNHSKVAVIGAGNIGICCVLMAKALAQHDVDCIDINEAKREIADRCGVNKFAIDVRELKEQSYDAVFIACDYPEVLNHANILIKPGGYIVVVSYFAETMNLNLNQTVRNETRIIGSALADWSDFEKTIDLVATGIVAPLKMQTHTFGLNEAATAMATMNNPSGCVGKILLNTEL